MASLRTLHTCSSNIAPQLQARFLYVSDQFYRPHMLRLQLAELDLVCHSTMRTQLHAPLPVSFYHALPAPRTSSCVILSCASRSTHLFLCHYIMRSQLHAPLPVSFYHVHPAPRTSSCVILLCAPSSTHLFLHADHCSFSVVMLKALQKQTGHIIFSRVHNTRELQFLQCR